MNSVPPIFEPADNNPFVGPVPFAPGQILYGRERETSELSDLIVSKRIVLLFSPSGAGKTSLIQAALLPGLDRRYPLKPLPIVRLDRFSAECEDCKPSNRYAFSTMCALETMFPPEDRLSNDALAKYSLIDYFRHRLGPGKTEFGLLVFDQFEELFTTFATDTEAKHEFLGDLGAVLAGAHEQVRPALATAGDQDPESDGSSEDSRSSAPIWALFSMREDRIAELEPYLHLVPTGLAFRYRIDCLGPAQAFDAIVKPGRGLIAPEAARQLVDDLRSVTVIGAGGVETVKQGRHVEPVQLQVVCRGLWEKVVVGMRQPIGLPDVESVSDGVNEVERALRSYFDTEMATVAGGTGVSERGLREWIEATLVSAGGIRTQALLEPGRMGEHLDEAIEALVQSHVLRSEMRNDCEWVELAHDRLVSPMRAANSAWRRKHMQPFQVRAKLFEADSGDSSKLLIGGFELLDARRFARNHPGELRPIDRRFIAESTLRQLRHLAVAASIGLAIFAITTSIIIQKGNRLDMANTEKNDWKNTAARSAFYRAASNESQRHPQSLGIPKLLDLSAEAERDYKRGSTEYTFVNLQLRAVLGNMPAVIERSLTPHRHLVSDLAFTADGERLVSSSWDQTLQVRNLEVGGGGTRSDRQGAETYAMANHDGRALVASTYMDGRVVLWQLEGLQLRKLGATPTQPARKNQQVTSAAFNADGTLLATVGWDKYIKLWDVRNPQAPVLRARFGKNLSPIQKAVFLPATPGGGQRLASADLDGVLRVWSLPAAGGAGQTPLRELRILNPQGEAVGIYSLAADPSGRFLAAGDAQGFVHLWDWRSGDSGTSSIRLSKASHDRSPRVSQVRSIAFAPGGGEFISAGLDGNVIRWRFPAGVTNVVELEEKMEFVRFGPIGERLFSATYRPGHPGNIAVGGTRSVWLLDLERGNAPLLAQPIPAQGAAKTRWKQVSLDQAGEVIGARAGDGRIHLWHRKAREISPAGVVDAQAAAFAITRKGDAVLAVDCSGFMTSWSVRGAVVKTKEAAAPADASEIRCPAVLAISPDDQFAATGAGDILNVWHRDGAGWRNVSRILGDALIRSLAFDANSGRLAIGVAQGWIVLIDIRLDPRGDLEMEGEEMTVYAGTEVRALSFVPGGKAIVSGEANGFLTQWSVPELKMEQTEFRHERALTAIVFGEARGTAPTPMFTTDLDGVTIEWSEGKLNGTILPVPTPTLPIKSAAVSGDGTYLVTASEEALLGWDLSADGILEVARNYNRSTPRARAGGAASAVVVASHPDRP